MSFSGSQFPLSGLIIYGETNSQGILIASSTGLITYHRDGLGQLTGVTSGPSFEITLFLHLCVAGYQLITTGALYSCVYCSLGTYSFDGLVCHTCPLAEAICYGSTIIVPAGYWRSSNTSAVIIKCINLLENCVGDYPNSE